MQNQVKAIERKGCRFGRDNKSGGNQLPARAVLEKAAKKRRRLHTNSAIELAAPLKQSSGFILKRERMKNDFVAWDNLLHASPSEKLQLWRSRQRTQSREGIRPLR